MPVGGFFSADLALAAYAQIEEGTCSLCVRSLAAIGAPLFAKLLIL
jgi:hypothetical protein